MFKALDIFNKKKSKNPLVKLSYDRLFEEALQMSRSLREISEKLSKSEAELKELSEKYAEFLQGYTSLSIQYFELFNKTNEEIHDEAKRIVDMLTDKNYGDVVN